MFVCLSVHKCIKVVAFWCFLKVARHMSNGTSPFACGKDLIAVNEPRASIIIVLCTFTNPDHFVSSLLTNTVAFLRLNGTAVTGLNQLRLTRAKRDMPWLKRLTNSLKHPVDSRPL